MTQGVITLLYKGKGSKALLDSYRPDTLLNSDYKLLAQALATRFGPALQACPMSSSSSYCMCWTPLKPLLSGPWIGDNAVGHLEDVEYLQQIGQPGCMVVLDFIKAQDRLSRFWVLDCMSSMRFGERACKWISIMIRIA